ncbi:CHAT domain-containing tetratricopeptide repeat protein [Leptothoe spongobia]|uniref:CHAT domain-containing protein n=1 Tax=Leptothoe spongobia TAU-MAC 1115 TaxID=1967444 RepID=A0A947DD76_9CYAN|nr:CHAT domain-containing tetratricopeptide repeat protein [Leptothoe spongobia]MBT9314843.1 CHAT domain-containing protein [Leptothoe spongobia TAU-MAC 1115]
MPLWILGVTFYGWLSQSWEFMAGFRTFGWMLGIGLLIGTGQDLEAQADQSMPTSIKSIESALNQSSTNSIKSIEAAHVQYEQAQNFLRLGSSRSAIFPLETAIQLYRSAGDPVGEHNSLIDLSFAHYRLGDHHRAQQALNRADQLSIPSSAAIAQRNRVYLMQALIWLEQGNVVRSWQRLRQVQRGLLQDFAEKNRLNLALGEIYRHTGQYSRALDTLQAARSSSSDRVDRTRILGEIGNIHYTLGDYGQAQSAYQTALAEAKSAGYWEGLPQFLNGLGHVYLQQQAYDKARDVYLEAREIAISQGQWHELASILNSLGELYAEQGAFNKALDTFTEALGYRDKYVGPEYSRSLNHLAQLYAVRQERETALAYYEDAYAWARHNYDEVGQINALSGFAEIERGNGNLPKAAKTLYQALDKFEALEPGLQDINKVSLFETQSYLYDQLQQVLIQQGEIEAALVVAERGRARAFTELLSKQTLETESPVPLMDLSINQIKSLAQKQATTLVQYSIIRQPSPGRSRFDDQALFIWVVKPTGEVQFEQVDLAQRPESLKEMLAASQDSLGVRGVNPWHSAANTTQFSQANQADLKQLYELTIAPIADYLPESPDDKVVVVPHRELFLVPFPALQNAQGTYLIEHHTLGTTPSLQTLHVLQQRSVEQSGQSLVVGIDRAQAASAVIVGNPDMPSVPFRVGGPPMPLSDLPGAEAEAIAIAPILNTAPLLGAAATETAVRERLADADIIHLATHGLLDEQRGLSSAIALTPTRENLDLDQPDDGLLTAQEVMQLNLKADLVVLSACNTGRGRITGDGVVGLSRSFLAAGANNLVASLWAVPDEATAMLMTEFYQQLQTEPDKAVALRQAMLSTLAQHPNPRDWAAFFLIGL